MIGIIQKFILTMNLHLTIYNFQRLNVHTHYEAYDSMKDSDLEVITSLRN